VNSPSILLSYRPGIDFLIHHLAKLFDGGSSNNQFKTGRLPLLRELFDPELLLKKRKSLLGEKFRDGSAWRRKPVNLA
jgi:hypothetical protein